MHHSPAVDTRHLLCCYVLSGRYSHRDEATYANCAPNSGTEEWLEICSRTAGKHRLPSIRATVARPLSPGCPIKDSRCCLSPFSLFSSKFSQFPALDCTWQVCGRDDNSLIQIKLASSQLGTGPFSTKKTGFTCPLSEVRGRECCASGAIAKTLAARLTR